MWKVRASEKSPSPLRTRRGAASRVGEGAGIEASAAAIDVSEKLDYHAGRPDRESFPASPGAPCVVSVVSRPRHEEPAYA